MTETTDIMTKYKRDKKKRHCDNIRSTAIGTLICSFIGRACIIARKSGRTITTVEGRIIRITHKRIRLRHLFLPP